MTKISVSLPDELALELRDEAVDNVSRFVATAVRDALDRRRLTQALAELDTEFGPLAPEDIADAESEFSMVEAAQGSSAGDSSSARAHSTTTTEKHSANAGKTRSRKR